ncbi:MAG: acetate/propionate family kinase [Sphingomonadaceae bacterium]|uniref:acetate/propionate family kinase n=1 Tax=Thermaurantiacus sp. TaxID=2820283 RepID=UPI00298F2332|nr:acetate/propionate family kinase [Thermaurantiacus sp.]MCS6986858.1 acetate/propionate family kinase [Sphingomonadaceae bacterium]MDW8415542.1 acetate/propionate family kinase [Thermaurantiacus sp.]
MDETRGLSPGETLVFTLNAGSSSLKFALFREDPDEDPERLATGVVEAIGPNARLRVTHADGGVAIDERPAGGIPNQAAALARVLGWLESFRPEAAAAAVGHRIVHGGPDLARPVRIDAEILDALARLEPLAPLHQPNNLAGVRAAMAAFPQAVQVACFDTAFHQSHDRLRQTFPLPLKYYEAGVRRYGFHGLSYESVVDRLGRQFPEVAAGRIVVAHLGNGASMAAIRAGRPVATTMGFTALDGLMMGTRSGSLDPGVLLYLLEVEGLSLPELTHMLYEESGLRGVSGLSNDLRVLEASAEPAAALAIEMFVDRAARAVGELAVVLGGLDALVFTAGIGENSARIRASIAERLAFLGLSLDPQANASGGPVISATASLIRALVVSTDEEAMIARHALAVLREVRTGTSAAPGRDSSARPEARRHRSGDFLC